MFSPSSGRPGGPRHQVGAVHHRRDPRRNGPSVCHSASAGHDPYAGAHSQTRPLGGRDMRLRRLPGPAGTSWVPTGSLWGETEAVPVPGIAEAVGLAEAIALHDVPAPALPDVAGLADDRVGI